VFSGRQRRVEGEVGFRCLHPGVGEQPCDGRTVEPDGRYPVVLVLDLDPLIERPFDDVGGSFQQPLVTVGDTDTAPVPVPPLERDVAVTEDESEEVHQVLIEGIGDSDAVAVSEHHALDVDLLVVGSDGVQYPVESLEREVTVGERVVNEVPGEVERGRGVPKRTELPP